MSLTDLRCKNILITGGGSGIGKAIAARFAQDAETKIVICGRTKEKIDAALAEIGSDRVFGMVWDISDVSAFAEKIAICERLLGAKPDGFVNNAAIGCAKYTGRGYEPWDITEQEWDALNDTNYKAAFFAMRNQVDYLLAAGMRGNILNFSSNATCMDVIGSYGAAKLAILKWTRAFGKRFGKNGIIINGIAPGATVTPMIERYAKSVDQPYERHAIGRFIRPEEIAELAHYLMSGFGEIVCGHTVVADGGDHCATL